MNAIQAEVTDECVLVPRGENRAVCVRRCAKAPTVDHVANGARRLDLVDADGAMAVVAREKPSASGVGAAVARPGGGERVLHFVDGLQWCPARGGDVNVEGTDAAFGALIYRKE